MFYLQRNLPWWERMLRPALGVLIAIIATNLQASSIVFWSAIAVAVTLALTGLVGFCPACAMVGRRSIRSAS